MLLSPIVQLLEYITRQNHGIYSNIQNHKKCVYNQYLTHSFCEQLYSYNYLNELSQRYLRVIMTEFAVNNPFYDILYLFWLKTKNPPNPLFTGSIWRIIRSNWRIEVDRFFAP